MPSLSRVAGDGWRTHLRKSGKGSRSLRLMILAQTRNRKRVSPNGNDVVWRRLRATYWILELAVTGSALATGCLGIFLEEGRQIRL